MTGVAISVVIPVRDGERFIGEALDSVSGQLAPPIEIIVIDDGSTDQTGEIVRGLQTSVPLRYHRQDNQGPSAARNHGVSIARGEWIAFLDADDLWLPDHLATHAENMRVRPDVALLSSKMDYIDDTGQPRPAIDWNDVLTPLLVDRSIPLLPSTITMRTDVLVASGGFDPRIRHFEDFELCARIARVHPVHSIDRTTVRYRTHGQQLHRDREHRAQGWPLLFRALMDLWKDSPEKQAILTQRATAVFTDLGISVPRPGAIGDT